MIDVVYKGWNPGGLIRYVFGPGRWEGSRHENPRVVATWDARPAQWQPEHVGPGEFDYDLSKLITALQAPLKAGRLPVVNPSPKRWEHRRFFKTQADGTRVLRDGTVRHLVLRNAEGDRKLSDAEWGFVAEELVHRAGWSRRDDPGGPRWVAARHDDDGIHIVAVMVRDDGKRVWPWNDYTKLRKAAREMERRFGVTITAESDGTAAVAPSRAEREKHARRGQDAAREELRAAVAQAAAVSLNEHDFEHALTEAGYLVEISRLPSGDLRGYKVARRGDTNSAGTPIWYSGSKLAADMSMPRLTQRWAQARRGRRNSAEQAPAASGELWVRRTLTVLDEARVTLADDPSQVDGIAHAVGEVWAVVDRGDGRLVHGAGARWDRAARAPYAPVPATGRVAEELRWMARGLGANGVSSSAALELTAALAALALQIAALYQHSQREHQARAARQSARRASGPQPARPPARPTQPVVRPGLTRRRTGESSRTSTQSGLGQQSWRRRRSTPPPPPQPGGPEPGRSR